MHWGYWNFPTKNSKILKSVMQCQLEVETGGHRLTLATGICCPSYDSIRPDDFKCIIEGANGFQNPSLILPPVELSCEQGPPGDRGQKGSAGQTGPLVFIFI